MIEKDRSDYFAISGKGKLHFPQCNQCKNLHRNTSRSITCEAFPNGIPNEITSNKYDHHAPYPGDNGIKFEEVK